MLPRPRMNLSGLTKLPVKLILMEQIKTYLYAVVFGATVLFPVLSVQAQTNAQGGNDRIIESTIVEETPEVVTQERNQQRHLRRRHPLRRQPVVPRVTPS